ncbi:MAG: hypothetical protein JSV78_07750, partial [Phycisphaerales bacterium]
TCTPGAITGDECGYSQTFTYSASDTCGNPVSETATYTWSEDETAPVITCPPDYTHFGCDDCPTDPEITGYATATDNCGGEVDVSYDPEEDVIVGDCPKVIIRTWTATDECGNSSSCTQIITCVPPSQVTNSGLCIFDCDAEDDCQSFRLLFTQDPHDQACFKLTASNPGQYYYNVFGTGTPGDTVNYTITLPYPFVTQGAMPIHVYDNVTGYAAEGDLDETCPAPLCFEPGIEHDAFSTQVTLGDYGPHPVMGDAYSFDVSFTVPETEFFFLAIHLDYGLKGEGGYTNDAYDNARVCMPDGGVGMLVIANPQEYQFAWDLPGDPPSGGTASICSFNEWKRNPGVGGVMLLQSDGTPINGGEVTLLLDGDWLSSSPVDEGWYVIPWRHTGKPTWYTAQLTPPDGYVVVSENPKDFKLKAMHFEEVSFEIAPGP